MKSLVNISHLTKICWIHTIYTERGKGEFPMGHRLPEGIVDTGMDSEFSKVGESWMDAL